MNTTSFAPKPGLSFAALRPLAGLALVILATALWATVGVAVESMPHRAALDPTAIGMVRTALGGLALLGTAALLGRLSLRRPPWEWLALFGAGAAVFQICLFRAFAEMGVTVTVAVTACLPPLLVAMAEAVLARRLPSPALVGGLALASLGVMLAVLPGATDTPRAGGTLGGWALLMGASVGFAVLAMAACRAGRSFDRLTGTGLALLIATAFLAVPVALSERSMIAGLSTLTSLDTGILLYVGIGATGLAYFAFTTGLGMCRSSMTGLVASMLEPVMAGLLAMLILGELVGPQVLLGCATIMAAVALAASAGSGRRGPARPLG